MINDTATVQYVAHTAGVQIIGVLPPDLAHIELKDQVSRLKLNLPSIYLILPIR